MDGRSPDRGVVAVTAAFGAAARHRPGGGAGRYPAEAPARSFRRAVGGQEPRSLADRRQVRLPPFGYQDTNGTNKGYDVEVAKQFARWAFGNANRVEYTCVTTASRIPTLLSKRVDIIIATITWTAEREQQIDFSPPYYGAIGQLLVPNATTVGRLSSWMRASGSSSTSGSIYDRWIRNCFKDTNFQVIPGECRGARGQEPPG